MSCLQFSKTRFQDIIKIMPVHIYDKRGFFDKYYSYDVYSNNQINFVPVEETFNKSNKGTIRGLHFQKDREESRLLTCISGLLWTIVLDITPNNSTFGEWISIELNAGMSLFVPGGYAIGSLAIEESLFHLSYNVPFISELATGIRWDDDELNIPWPKMKGYIISEKDKGLQSFVEYRLRLRKDKHDD